MNKIKELLKKLSKKSSGFECEYCSKEFEFENNVIKHEKTCNDNPDYKSPPRVSKKEKKARARRETRLRSKLKMLEQVDSNAEIETIKSEIRDVIKNPPIREKKYATLMGKAQNLKEKRINELKKIRESCVKGQSHNWEQIGGARKMDRGKFKKTFICRKCNKT